MNIALKKSHFMSMFFRHPVSQWHLTAPLTFDVRFLHGSRLQRKEKGKKEPGNMEAAEDKTTELKSW